MFELFNSFINFLNNILNIIAVIMYGSIATVCLLILIIGRELWNQKLNSRSSTEGLDQKIDGNKS